MNGLSPFAKLRFYLACLIAATWFGSIIADAAIKSYDPPATIHILMMGMCGALFTTLRKDGDK